MEMEELVKIWKPTELLKFQASALNALNLEHEQFKFLQEIGLPSDAAPALSFNSNLETLNKHYNLGDSNFDLKIVLGSDGSGDPICIDLSDLKIYACDHESGFEGKFMNSNPIELFKFLSAFKIFVEDLIERKGEDAFFDCDFTDEDLNKLTEKMSMVDSTALKPNTFWYQEIETLKANRAYYKNES